MRRIYATQLKILRRDWTVVYGPRRKHVLDSRRLQAEPIPSEFRR